MKKYLRSTWILISLLHVTTTGFGQYGSINDDPEFTIKSLETITNLSVPDCDGLALGDINGDGKTDILTSASTTSLVFWFERGDTPRDWTRHLVWESRNNNKIEGNDLGDFDGNGSLEGISLDQRQGQILLHKQMADRSWQTAAIMENRPILQDSFVKDLDGNGRPELIYTFEGNKEGVGGVHRLELTGDDPLNPAHWRDHTLSTYESAWWLVPDLMQFSGDGEKNDIVYTARHLLGRNPGSRPGLFWLERPAKVSGKWQSQVIDTTLEHPLHVDNGNFSGNGSGQDLVVGGFSTDRLYWYDFSSDWKRNSIPVPEIRGKAAKDIWNVRTLPFRSNGRDLILAVPSEGNWSQMVVFEYLDGVYRGKVLKELPYGHPMEDRILFEDLNGDGTPEMIIADSGGHLLRIMEFVFRD
ncbi:FG-GAP repeat domain-containing protein [Halalkalibaculum sp. DA3122]|uniref:FG-GAP repeat domain-containing protein n=1 Tax=Halalkalibaculum sp. DA3122 TaxID=3373607 RepID=UPI0037544E1A